MAPTALTALASALLLMLAFCGHVAPSTFDQRIVASDRAVPTTIDRQFGGWTALSGDGLTVVVGDPRDDEAAVSAGAAYIYLHAQLDCDALPSDAEARW